MTTSAKLACPECGSTDLSTIEQLRGYANTIEITTAGPDHAGETEVDWDSSTTIGVDCDDCNWEHVGDDWLTILVPATNDGEDQ